MLCQRCKKTTATVHITDITEANENVERHLCERCAEQEGVMQKTSMEPLNELLTNFVLGQAGAAAVDDLRCESCGMTFADFRSQGVLGCPADYEVFGKLLDPLISQAHEGATHHTGHIPAGRPATEIREHELIRLQRELDSAVAREDYESAARLRDQLKAAESAGVVDRR
jgi:protein arginine kinase activator